MNENAVNRIAGLARDEIAAQPSVAAAYREYNRIVPYVDLCDVVSDVVYYCKNGGAPAIYVSIPEQVAEAGKVEWETYVVLRNEIAKAARYVLSRYGYRVIEVRRRRYWEAAEIWAA